MKRTIPVVLVGLASLGAWVGVLVSISTEQPSIGARQPEEPPGTTPLVTSTSDRARLRALIGQRRWLVGGASDEHPSDVELVDRDQELDEEPGNDDEHEDDDDEDDEVDGGPESEEASLARSREAAERWVEAITTAADLEAVDLDWAPGMERQIAEGLAAQVSAGATLISATCKTTLCITEIEFPPDEGRSRRVSRLAAFGLSRGFFVRHEPELGRGARMVAYLAREGYSLPR